MKYLVFESQVNPTQGATFAMTNILRQCNGIFNTYTDALMSVESSDQITFRLDEVKSAMDGHLIVFNGLDMDSRPWFAGILVLA